MRNDWFARNSRCAFLSVLFLAFGLPQIVFGQTPPTTLPLGLSNNYMVTGDYVVGGWSKTGSTTINGTLMSTGTIPIPDPGAYATNVPLQQVPPGADVVAAFLYWQTVENSGVHSGQNGFFNNGSFNYPISGTVLGNLNAPVSWSAGGCAGAANGSKTIVTYRADLGGLLPVDANGNIQPNTTYQVSLPDTGRAGQPPFTEGATLVIIYRLLAPSEALNAVVIYDGSYSPSNGELPMSQPMLGFFQAGNDQAAPIVSKITHIVGNGQSNKLEQVYLNNYDVNGNLVHSTLLPSLYGTNPPFPGNYNGSWDNATWFPNTYPTTPSGDSAVEAGESSETTVVVPNPVNKGCVSWGAIVLSATIQDSNLDGLADVWKKNQGYCDARANAGMSNQGTCPAGTSDPAWVSLAGASTSNQDIFIQLDYMCTKVINNANGTTTCDPSGVSYKPNAQAINNLVSAFSANGHDINVHVVSDDNNVILAQTCTDNTAASPPVYCPFPGQAGVVGWKSGFSVLKTQPLNYPDETSCETQTPQGGAAGSGPPCKRRFPYGQNNSYHEAIFGVAAGTPTWAFAGGSLTGITASGSTLTFTMLNPHGLVADPNDTGIPNGRITILNAISNPSLNNTYLVQSAPTPNTFTIQVPSGTIAPNSTTDPFLLLVPGVASEASGVSDIGGADSLITLGLWGPDGQAVSVESGTFMHELGHTLALTHGGLFRTPVAGGYSYSFEPNCKSNFQSVMNYLFQVNLLDGALDYSEQVENTISESAASPPDVLSNAIHPTTMWYAPNQTVGSPATTHCDGSPLLSTDQPMFRLQGPANAISWSANQDINFDGKIESSLQGYNDWANLDLRQVGASGNDFWAGGVFPVKTTAGGVFPVKTTAGGVFPVKTTAGGVFPVKTTAGGVGEIDFHTATSTVPSPTNLTAALTTSNTVQLTFTPPGFPQGQIAAFNIYRSVNGAANQTAYATVPVSGTPLPLPNSFTYTDTQVACGTYSYFVTTVFTDGRESVSSNTASATPTCTTSVVVTSSVNPSTFGQSVTFTATVTNTTSTTAPTGSVQFYLDGTVCGGLLPLSGVTASGSASATLTVSSPSCTTTLTVNGSPHTVKAVYSNADGSFSGSFGTLGQTVNPAPTSTAVSSSVNPSIYGQSVTFTATVANTAGAAISTATPTGSVQFSIDGAPFGAAVPLSGSGASASGNSGATATLIVNGSPHTVKVVYSNADGNFIGSFGTLGQTVNPAPTSTTVSSSVNPSIYGQSVTFTATVANTAGAAISTATPTGSVQFSIDGAPFGAAVPLSGSGARASGNGGATATLIVNGSPHTVKVVYSNADGNFIGSLGTQGQTVNPAPTSTTVSSSLNPSIYGQSVTFTATVANTAGAAISTATPTGSVQFMDGATPLGTAQIVSGLGTATLTSSALAVGAHPITAVYSNSDGNFLGSTSAIVNQVVQDFSITVTPSTQTIPSGHQAIYTITVTPINGLTGSIALSCSGMPPNSTCSVSPSTAKLQGSAVASTVTLNSNKNVNHGTFTLTFTGTLAGSNLSHTTTVQLTVQ